MANDPVFLDAGGLIALINERDWLHHRAFDLFNRLQDQGRTFITTSLILAETGNGLARSNAREQGADFISALLASPSCCTIFVEQSLFGLALDQYRRYRDKQWGLVDCVSFEVMRATRINEAFSADRHFEQAGYRCLL
jgi:uncharacterized protein